MKHYFRYWGKASKEDETYHLLVFHCLDVAAVSMALLQNHPFYLKRLATLFRLSEDSILKWGAFLLGLHDLGKFAETFQQCREDLRQSLWPDKPIRHHSYNLRHDSLGALLWQEKLRLSLFPELNDAVLYEVLPEWLAPVFGHHGEPPKGRDRLKNHFRDYDMDAALAFADEWAELMQPDVQTIIECSQDSSWQQQQKEASWLLAGLAVLCDWLGSNTEFFRYHDTPMPLADYWHKHALPAAQRAIEQAGILPQPVRKLSSPFVLFDYIDRPTPLQQACADIDIQPGPQLFILEDITGAGKTEAAMILALRLMLTGLGEGIYIGLPTMATANAMYERMQTVYRGLYAMEAHPSLILSHSARHLSDAFRQSLLNAQPEDGGYDQEESISAQCNRWLADNRKKALLADVGVGTIDQALLGVMPARHQSLRLLGLMNKVLILDEVHAYDSYTLQPLKQLLRFHAAFGGSAILLSATLSQAQREELLAAFAGHTVTTQCTDYPLLTRLSHDRQPPDEQPTGSHDTVCRMVGVRLLHEEAAVLETVRQAVEAGHCVCWIRNTVSDAREAWQQLAQQSWMDTANLHQFHSRYALGDRLAIEQDMLARFGKESTEEQRARQVLVATQVVEQSLDLDFDVMITDLAPIDLLIQRAGRLQRHLRGRRPEPVLHVLSPKPVDEPDDDWYKAMFPKATFVYRHTAVLWRTARWLARKGGWQMPEDARSMIEHVYTEGATPAGLSDSEAEAVGVALGERDAGQFSSLRLETGYRDTERWEDEAIVATRLGEESHTIYLARWQDDQLRPWINIGPYPWDMSSLRVNANQIKWAYSIDGTPWLAALERLRAEEKRFDEHSIILPLENNNGSWTGCASDNNGRPIEVTYSATIGLEIKP